MKSNEGPVMISDHGNTIHGLKVEVRVHWNHEANDFVAYIKILCAPNTLPRDVKRDTKVPLKDLRKTLVRLFCKLKRHYNREHREKELKELKDRERTLKIIIEDLREAQKEYDEEISTHVKEQIKVRAKRMALQYGEPGGPEEHASFPIHKSAPQGRCEYCDNPIDDSF